MSRINLLQSGMQGVDLKSNPLSIGEKKKLRFAQNMVFEEGVLKSRPGIRYEDLCASGQFQGAADFQPTRGISYQPFGEGEGIALVVNGSLYLNGEKLSGNIFKEKGPVNLFQAENYLIIQNTETSTYWWDGGTLTESPGMNEVDFAEVETPVHEMEIVPPVADIIPCIFESGSTYSYLFIVIDHVTEARIASAFYELNVNENIAYSGASNSQGQFSLIPDVRDYTYNVSRLGYYAVRDVPLSVVASDHTIYVRMVPIVDQCLLAISGAVTGGPSGGEFYVNNVGNVAVILTGIATDVEFTDVSIDFPYTLAPGSNITISVGDGPLVGGSFTLQTYCGNFTNTHDYTLVWDAGDILYVRLSFWTATSSNEGSWAHEVIPIPYTSPTLEYHGTCSKGGFTIEGGAWPGDHEFKISFDVSTPIPEDYLPNPGATYKPLYGPFGLDNNPADPAGQYTLTIFDNGRPYPDWTAFVSHTPIPE